MVMRSQEVLVNRFVQWERILERLKKFTNSGSLRIYYEGIDSDAHDPTVYPSGAGDPERYLVDAFSKAISNKRDSESKQLRCFRPNVLAINYLLSEEFQTANTRQKQLGNKIPDVKFGETIDAVYLAACGIDTVFSKGTLIIGRESHPFSMWLKRHGLT
jgi:hypothetical protein